MTDKITDTPVVAVDTTAAMVAALSRIEDVPSSSTMIDLISDAEWMSDDVADWKVEAGSGDTTEIDLELDGCDNNQMNGDVA